MKKHYKELKQLFPLDPLLMFAVAYICPVDDLADLCGNIDLPYAMAIVAKKLDNIHCFSEPFPKVRQYFELNIVVMLSHTAC